MSFPSFSALRTWRATLRADSPPPPLLKPSSLPSHSHHQPSPYLDVLDPQPSEPSTPLPQDDFSYNDASASPPPSVSLEPFPSTPNSQPSTPHPASSILLPVSMRPMPTPDDPSPPPSVLLGSPVPSPAPALPHSASAVSTISFTPVARGGSPSFPSLPAPSPPPAMAPGPTRLHPPALQASAILAHCRAWLLATEEYEVRARLNLTASDKHALKVRLHQGLQRFQADEKQQTQVLEQVHGQEEALRRELDALMSQIARVRRGKGEGESVGDVEELREQRQALWASLEALIHRRNGQRSALLTVQQSVTCMTQALYQTHIFMREQYTQFSSPDPPPGPIDTTQLEVTPVKPPSNAQASPGSRISLARRTGSQPGSLLGSPQAPSSPREGVGVGVKFVSCVDEWVLASVGKLGELRATEGRLQKRLDKLTASRSQIQSYFERIAVYTKRQQANDQPTSNPTKRTTDSEPPTGLLLLVRGLRQLGSGGDGDAEARLDQEQLTALVYEHRNRKVLHRVLETIESSGLLTARRVAGDVHSQSIAGNELVLWFVKSNLLPTATDALELIDLLCRAGLLIPVPSATPVGPATAGSGSFASPSLQQSVFILPARAAGCGWEDLTRSGWMEKVGRYRSYPRYFVWDTDLRRLAYYESHRDAQPMRTYTIDSHTAITALESRLHAQLLCTSAPPPATPPNGPASKFHLELVFRTQQHGEASLLLAVASEEDRREWIRVLSLGLTAGSGTSGKRKEGGGLGMDMKVKGGMLPSLSFSADSSIFPALSLPVDPHSFTGSKHPPASPQSPSSPSSSPLERSKEQLRLSEFSVSRAKSALILQSSISHVESRGELDLGLIDILNEPDDLPDPDQPGAQCTPVKPRGDRPNDPEGDDFLFEEEDDEDNADEDAEDEDDDDIIPGQLPTPPRPDPTDAYTALRKAQRRRKTLRAVGRLQAMIRDEASSLGRLVAVFVKLFRSLYAHALDVDDAPAPSTQSTPLGSLYSSSSFSFTPYGSTAGRRGRERGTPASSPLESPTASAGASRCVSALHSPSVSQWREWGSLSPALEYYSVYPRHVRYVLRSGKEDIDTFLQQMQRVISTHLQPDPFQSDPTLQSLLHPSYIPSSLYIAGSPAHSVLSPTPSQPAPSSAVLLAHRNRDAQSIVRACHRVLSRHVHQCVGDVLLPIYEVKCADRDREAEARMRALTDVRWDVAGLSPELVLLGMKRTPEPMVESGNALADELNAAHEEREGTEDREASFVLPALDLSLGGSGSGAPAYHYALKELDALAGTADPFDKLSCVLRVARAICRSVDEARAKQAVVINADDLLLLFAYLLVASTAAGTACRWHAHLALMADYVTDKQRCMLRGYYLATMQAALELIMTGDLAGDEAGRSGLAAGVSDGELSALDSASSESMSSVGSAASGESHGTPEEDMGELVVIVQ